MNANDAWYLLIAFWGVVSGYVVVMGMHDG